MLIGIQHQYHEIDGFRKKKKVRAKRTGMVNGLVSGDGVGRNGDSSGGSARRNGSEYSGKVVHGVLSNELERDAITFAKVEVKGKWERAPV